MLYYWCMDSPFPHAAPLAPADMIDREHEAELLTGWAFDGVNGRLVAPRQYGKTTLLRRIAADARDGGLAAVYVDFFGVLTLTDVAERIEQAYAAQLTGPLAAWFTTIRRTLRSSVTLGGGPVPASATVSADPQASAPLLDRLDVPRKLFDRHGVRALVIFDEFQDVMAARDRADAVIRSQIQHHGEAATYMFAGSHVGMMRELFGDRRRAFYSQARPLELSPLPVEDTGEFVARRFEASGRAIDAEAMGLLLDAADGHPQRTMVYADALWRQTGPNGTADVATWWQAYDDVLREARPALRALWQQWTPRQQRVLATIADNRSALYAKVQPHGGSRGSGISRAVAELEAAGEIVEDRRTATGRRLVDPLFAAWIAAGRPGE
jgi:hypothetical protein